VRVDNEHIDRCPGGLDSDELVPYPEPSQMNRISSNLALFLPPVAAFLKVGLGLHFWLNLILTLIFFVPGMIHALWLVVYKAGQHAPGGPG
jgi:uncharacterized membrane protein YqaE (UPF0057 family)